MDTTNMDPVVIYLMLYYWYIIINPQCACTRVMVVVLCVCACVCVCVSLFCLLTRLGVQQSGISGYSAENAVKVKSGCH